MNNNQPEHTQWTGSEQHGFQPVGETTSTLPPNIYYVAPQAFGSPVLRPMNPQTDKPIVVGGGLAHRIFTGIEAFWKAKEKYDKYGLIHKRGYLLHGIPGCGKTLTCIILASEVIKLGGFCLFNTAGTNSQYMRWGLQAIRSVQKDAPIVNIIEDIDVMDDVWGLLSTLDGENQVGNVVHIATTNFVNELDERVTNRPSRFDEVIETLLPEDERDPQLIARLAAASSGLMLAHLRELVVAHVVLGKPIDEEGM